MKYGIMQQGEENSRDAGDGRNVMIRHNRLRRGEDKVKTK